MKFWIKYFTPALLFVLIVVTVYIFTNTHFAQANVNADIEVVTKKELTDRSIKLPDYKITDKDTTNVIKENKNVVKDNSSLKTKVNLAYEILLNNKIVKDFKRDYSIMFTEPKDYSEIEGISCFRGNNFRNSASYGLADVTKGKLEKVWNVKNGYIDEWTGVGWTGQPSIVKWKPNIRQMMNLLPIKKNKNDLKEVIYATLDGKIYFLDLDNGEATRQTINIGSSHKGSLSIDPRGYPLLYTGQGIETVGGKTIDIGFRIFNLINQKELFFINGMDPFALRSWGAFDSNALVDKCTDTLLECGENGVFYTAKLNTNFDQEKAQISIKPELVRYRYHSPKNDTIGMENSAAFYKNFAYFTDNSGTLQCINLDTLTPVWLRDVTDDSDSSIVVEETSDTEISLYTACEVDRQGENGSAFVRKINALTGDLIWEKAYKCLYDAHTNGGVLGTGVIGKKDISNLVIYCIAKIDKSNKGKLIAFDKTSGNEAWVLDLDNYCWSSPVDVYTKDGKSYIIQCDSAGTMFLIEGKTGKVIDKISLEANIEASPAIYDNMIVVGTRGQKIWGIKIK